MDITFVTLFHHLFYAGIHTLMECHLTFFRYTSRNAIAVEYR